MAQLTRFDRGGLELLINQETGESFASLSGYGRMADVADSTIQRRLKKEGTPTLTVANPNGGLPLRLISEETIAAWLIRDNPGMARAMSIAGVRVYLHSLAGYKVSSGPPTPAGIEKAPSAGAIFLRMAQAYLDMEKEMALFKGELADIEARVDQIALVLPRQGYSTIAVYCHRLGIKPPNGWKVAQGTKAAKLCKEAGRTVYKVPDDRYPGGVNSYPDDILAVMDWSFPGYNHFDPSFGE